MNSEEILCMDEGFSLIEAENKSFIGYEYLKHIRFGMQGYALILKLVQDNRIDFVTKQVPAPASKTINRTGIKKSDRIFVKVAYNSSEQILITHDYEDFSTSIRAFLHDKLSIRVIDANEL